jgi:hypothetical protein
MARSEPGLAVHDKRSRRTDDYRVEVELHELGNLIGDIGDRSKDHNERLPIERRCTPIPVQQWGGAERSNRGVGATGSERRNGERVVIEEIGHHTAESDHHNRTEIRIDGEPDNPLDTG